MARTDDRAYLLTRCLRLEARIVKLQQERDALRKLIKLLRRFAPKDYNNDR